MYRHDEWNECNRAQKGKNGDSTVNNQGKKLSFCLNLDLSLHELYFISDNPVFGTERPGNNIVGNDLYVLEDYKGPDLGSYRFISLCLEKKSCKKFVFERNFNDCCDLGYDENEEQGEGETENAVVVDCHAHQKYQVIEENRCQNDRRSCASFYSTIGPAL